MTTSQRDRVRMIWCGVGLALIGCALGIVGALGAGQPLSLIGWATFVAGWVIAGVAAVKAGYHFGRRR
jgi:hypothetical protein